MMKKLEALIEVRKIIALMFSLLFTFLSITGQFSPDVVINVILIVVGYYFGKSTALDQPKGDGKNDHTM